jgi:hypothetical protein
MNTQDLMNRASVWSESTSGVKGKMRARGFGPVAIFAIAALSACSAEDAGPKTSFPGTGGSTSTGTSGAGGGGAAGTGGTTTGTGGTTTGTGGATTGTGGATTGTGGATTGAGGTGGSGGGTGGSSGAGTGGSAGSAGSSGGSGGAGGTMDSGSAGMAGQRPDGGSADAGGQPTADGGDASSGNPITKVVPTAGCGMDPGQAVGTAVRGTIVTMGTKPAGCADSLCGPWTYTREYFVTLPTGYVNTRAYPLVFQGPGCGATGTANYPLNDGMGGPGSVGNTVIRVGLTPPPNTIGHATNPNQGCFDDKEGDDSVDWVFYENLWDKLALTLCFDKNRVFASGNSSGAWFSNEVGCKYAGDPVHPIRGIMPNTGGLPTEPQYVPTCTTKPMAGMWIHEINDTTNPFSGNIVAIDRAMRVNGCTGTTYNGAMFDDFPIGGGNPATTCKKIRGCPDIAPLVVCALPGNGHGSHDNVANPGFSTFIKLFSAPPLITP